MSKELIPRKAVYRLSQYHRCLERLQQNEAETVSSTALAAASGVKPAQLRKDLAYCGQFGTRGIGYNVAELTSKLHDVLGTTHLQPVIMVGVGNMGSALMQYQGFAKEGFEFVAAFDESPNPRVHAKLSVEVLPASEMPDFVRKKKVKMAILAVPGTVAQEVTNRLVDAGIQAILNFAPIILQVPDRVVVNNVDLALELENLSYFTSADED